MSESIPGLSNKKATSSVQDVAEEKPAFGSRFLTEDDDVWSQNAWDHVPPPDDQLEKITESLSKQRLKPVPQEEKEKYNAKPAKHWDNFYKMNANNFFRNRKWLHNEFPELVAATQPEAGPFTIIEIGCGAGNSVFPLLAANRNAYLDLRAYDYSSHAVKLVQNDPLYTSPKVGSIRASVWDVTSPDGLPEDISPETVDIVILVFVMSALHPDEWGQAINNIQKMLKPGGLVVFRDYGRHDLTQLRFKEGRLLDDNFYIRGDKTRVYFFTLDELSLLFTGAKVSTVQQTPFITSDSGDHGDTENDPNLRTVESQPENDHHSSFISQSPPSTTLGRHHVTQQIHFIETTPLPSCLTSELPADIHPNLLSPLVNCPPHPIFTTEQLGVDRRLIVNRKRQLKMYRVWMQGKFRKPQNTYL
ncbi:methyltransferase [Phlegmacium glaucopus]|nr:methyltransferase [Phlegmacium glaucopus]